MKVRVYIGALVWSFSVSVRAAYMQAANMRWRCGRESQNCVPTLGNSRFSVKLNHYIVVSDSSCICDLRRLVANVASVLAAISPRLDVKETPTLPGATTQSLVFSSNDIVTATTRED